MSGLVMFFAPYESLLASRSAEELNAELRKATVDLGFATFSAMAMYDQPGVVSENGK